MSLEGVARKQDIAKRVQRILDYPTKLLPCPQLVHQFVMSRIVETLTVRWLRHYKIILVIGVIILGAQVFLAYKSLSLPTLRTPAPSLESNSRQSLSSTSKLIPNVIDDLKENKIMLQHSSNDDEGGDSAHENNDPSALKEKPQQPYLEQQKHEKHQENLSSSSLAGLGFQPKCEIKAKEAISALQRAKTKDCRQHIARVACAIQSDNFYAKEVPNYCPLNGNYTAHRNLGCYHDEKELRLFTGYFTNLKSTNTPKRCVQLCLQSGYPYAGVQYASECFCGVDAPPHSQKLADSSCNMKCTGNPMEICGGYYAMNVYETGIAKFTPRTAEISISGNANAERVKIAFLLTLNGRALRQVHRLIKALYAREHVYYIHVDARQDYLYRNLLPLETEFPNIRLARTRFSTIWGGASLLTMLLQSMKDLLLSQWHWDFVINLSESDFPVKTVSNLVDFLSANKGYNFVKSHGRETQRFIQKQGLDKTFVECDTHMWRIGDRQLPTGIQIDGGSDWVALSRPFVQYVTTGTERDELLVKLLLIFQHTLLPAESFFHTVLRNSRFCATYVDNNLHVTNWKRKLGCKCQYKHVVDWCGCSPNDFKPEDWSRLRGTEQKMLFFARKFEPIINQAILMQLEEWLFGPYTSEYANLQAYWQSLYHADDKASREGDLARTVGESVMRLQSKQAERLLEITNFMHNDQYKGFLVKYQVARGVNRTRTATATTTYETRVRPVQHIKITKNFKFAKRIRNFEVSSDFDQKEQIARNYAKFLGPHTELVLSFTLNGIASGSGSSSSVTNLAHSYNLTLLWIDPLGRLQDFNEIHIEDANSADSIHFFKTQLKPPLVPGIWVVKMIGRSGLYAQNRFLITPLAYEGGESIQRASARKLHAGNGLNLPADFSLPNEWLQYLPSTQDLETLTAVSAANAERYDEALLHWIDELVSRFFYVRESCIADEKPAESKLLLCRETSWSSMAPDPKSDVNSLLKRR